MAHNSFALHIPEQEYYRNKVGLVPLMLELGIMKRQLLLLPRQAD